MENTPIRILQVTRDLDLGGLQQVIYNLCRTVDRNRFDISVLCLTQLGCVADDVKNLGVPVYLLPQRPAGVDYFACLKVARLLKQLRINVVHTHNTQAFLDGTLGALLAGVKTIIHTDHARLFPDKKRYMIAEWVLSKFAYKVVGCSAHTSQQLIKYEKISPAKIITIPNGIDGSRFQLQIDKDAKLRELGIKLGPIIGVAGRLSTQKGITYLLQAMPAILQVHANTTLVIAGDGELRDALQQEANKLGIATSILFCGPRKDIPQLLQLFDIYVMPSLWEGLPMILLEAMAAGCPIVATNVGGNSSAVIHEQTGLLVEPASPSDLIKSVVKLLSDSALRQQYAQAAKALFEQNFSAANMTARYQELYLRRI
ncbi:MAG TPA: glycosyltransferase [Spongiibacteraceae bacterium]